MPFKTFQINQKGNRQHIFAILLFSFISNVYSQLKVTMPVERSVFQRVNNVASIHIGGNIPIQTDQIQARVIPIQGGEAIDWKRIDTSIGGGSFIGELSYVKGGWYMLEVRAMLNGSQVGDLYTVSKVGVGEVFIVAGQSNAQGGSPPMGGFYDNTKYAAQDDRVNCINHFDNEESALEPFPKISQLKAETFIAPHGQASWCWGILGDRIARELNVPVLFFNASEGGTRMHQWEQGSKGEQVYNAYTGYKHVLGWPYVILEKSLHYYASLYGLRAILWHQGEDDAVINTSPSAYSQDLQTVISKSREHSGKNVSWMVARVSRSKNGISEGIKAAQQAVININGFNVFQGPDTDGIQPSASLRDDGVHFHSTGLIELANAWADFIITENFMLNSKPFLANPLIKITPEQCQVTYEINASLPTNYSNPIWVWNGGNSRQSSFSKTIIAYDENYGLVRDNNKNYLMAPPFSFTPKPIEIKLSSQPKICEGASLGLSAVTTSNNYQWSTGENTKEISVTKSGEYKISVNSTDVYGCKASANTEFNLQVLQLPVSPTIEASSSTTFCAGDMVEIRKKSINNYSKIWSTSETSNSINISKSGSYFLQDIDENGCKSPISNQIEVKVNPLPQKPVISANEKNQFCFGDSLKLQTAKAWEYLWKEGNLETKTKANEFYIKNGGDYTVTSISEFGCVSQVSDKISILQLQLPQAPVIQIAGKTTICAGDSIVIFTENKAKGFSWFSDNGNIEASIVDKLAIKSSRNQPTSVKKYGLKITDENSCVSPNSNIISINVKTTPKQPIINQSGPYTLAVNTEKSSGSMVNYKWFFENKPFKTNDLTIKATESGIYKVLSEETYAIGNDNLTCISDFSSDFKVDLLNDELIIYPNPTVDGNFFIETRSDLVNVSITIFTPLGVEVFAQNNISTNKRNKIFVGNLNGFHIIELRSSGKAYRKGILIQN
jgi:Carbohydrate esterase, sialic acid-specific acetylesterase